MKKLINILLLYTVIVLMYINRVVLNYLNLPNKFYSPLEIKSALILKSEANGSNVNLSINCNKVFVMDLEGLSIFSNIKPKYTINMITEHIINNYQENTYIPDCYYYGYNQKPINIEKID